MSLTISSGLLAASMLLGQTGGAPTVTPNDGGKVVQVQNIPTPPTMTQNQPQPSRPIFGWFTREDRPVITKITGWFKRDQPEPQPQTQTQTPMRSTIIRETTPPPATKIAPTTPANDYPRRMPSPSSQVTKPGATIVKVSTSETKVIQQTAFQQAAESKNVKYPIRPELTEKIGRDDKFEWITGQLEIENGSYVIYYATPETIDTHHGRVVLAMQQVDAKQFHRGDLVSVRGQLGQQRTSQGTAPIYRVTMANLIERPKS